MTFEFSDETAVSTTREAITPTVPNFRDHENVIGRNSSTGDKNNITDEHRVTKIIPGSTFVHSHNSTVPHGHGVTTAHQNVVTSRRSPPDQARPQAATTSPVLRPSDLTPTDYSSSDSTLMLVYNPRGRAGQITIPSDTALPQGDATIPFERFIPDKIGTMIPSSEATEYKPQGMAGITRNPGNKDDVTPIPHDVSKSPNEGGGSFTIRPSQIGIPIDGFNAVPTMDTETPVDDYAPESPFSTPSTTARITPTIAEKVTPTTRLITATNQFTDHITQTTMFLTHTTRQTATTILPLITKTTTDSTTSPLVTETPKIATTSETTTTTVPLITPSIQIFEVKALPTDKTRTQIQNILVALILTLFGVGVICIICTVMLAKGVYKKERCRCCLMCSECGRSSNDSVMSHANSGASISRPSSCASDSRSRSSSHSSEAADTPDVTVDTGFRFHFHGPPPYVEAIGTDEPASPVPPVVGQDGTLYLQVRQLHRSVTSLPSYEEAVATDSNYQSLPARLLRLKSESENFPHRTDSSPHRTSSPPSIELSVFAIHSSDSIDSASHGTQCNNTQHMEGSSNEESSEQNSSKEASDQLHCPPAIARRASKDSSQGNTSDSASDEPSFHSISEQSSRLRTVDCSTEDTNSGSFCSVETTLPVSEQRAASPVNETSEQS